ncbi:MAG TPA: N-acetylmannosamine-6-phosphate 2-epimerase [Armatimonadota bacterium]|nr:N-acetylmannosamine-6-phosphate 2-epimerase [Armatimonadota bacterium]
MKQDVIERLTGGLIVSCQAKEDSPLCGPAFMAAMARCAEIGGAVGIRANGPDNIEAIREAVGLPIIGIYKINCPDSEPYITPTFEAAKEVAGVGADIIALDATLRPHANGLSARELIAQIKKLDLPVMADISTFEEGAAAEEAGADIIATTMSGYTSYSRQLAGPNFELISELAQAVRIPIIAEGRIWTPEQARKAIDLGAHAAVVGTAITRPEIITERFAEALGDE